MFCLVQDEDGHWFVIPENKMDKWEEYLDKVYNLEEYPEQPSWVDEIGGNPNRVVFPSYEIK